MKIGVEQRFFLGDEKGDLLWVWRRYFLADEDVGEWLIAIEKSAVVIEEEVVVELLGQTGSELYLGKKALDNGLLLGVGEDTPLLEQIVHLYLLSG